MAANFVLDASAAAKLLFTEVGSQEVRESLGDAYEVVAPDFVLLEIASVAAKKYRRREVSQERAMVAVTDAPDLFTAFYSTRQVASAAGEIAVGRMISPYDAAFVVLAQQTGYTLLTADRRLSDAIRQLREPPEVQLIAG
jgi:predicted nucleic acid-binding protein